MAADSVAGYICGLMIGVEVRRTSYALDRASRQAAMDRLFEQTLGAAREAGAAWQGGAGRNGSTRPLQISHHVLYDLAGRRPMRIFKNSWFARFARKERIGDEALCEAVARADRGLVDADLGGGLIKQWVARLGAGRSGGYRTLVFFRAGDLAAFAFGFAKKDRGNIDADDEERLKKAAKVTLDLTEDDMDRLVVVGTLIEVRCDDEED